MRITLLSLLLVILLVGSVAAQPGTGPVALVDLVNPLMGTFSKRSFSNGNTYPAIARPWGMNFWTPQTNVMGEGWTYQYGAEKIRGFKQTHQPSPWINDYGVFALMPVTGKLRFGEEERASWFSHKAETARPHYYSVYLADHDVTVEITPTERAARFRLTYPQTDSSFLVIDAMDMGSWIRVLPEERKIVGYSTKNSGGVPENFKNYFVIYLDKPFTLTRTWDGKKLGLGLERQGNHVGAVIGFKTRKGEQVNARMASSFISHEQAELNLQREIGTRDFDAIRAEGAEEWNRELGRIQVEGGNQEQLKTFYSCLYRVLLFPRKFFEMDAQNQVVHYSPYNGKVLPGYMFTDNGFWDTFRAVFPFFTVMYPTLSGQIMEGLANTYKESGWLPEWASPGHRSAMIGSNSAAIIADTYLKGIRGYDIKTLYEAILKNTEQEGPLHSVGRKGAAYYNRLGYVPYDVGINENAARTLEYAYADFTITKLAQALKRPNKEILTFARRSQNYRQLFDPGHRLMRGRNLDGSFQRPFNPFKWGDAFTEGNSWHYSWSVFQDVEGLVGLMGGKQPFVQMLDSVFELPPAFDASYYGSVIHEIREMQTANMGQYAHGNQPVQHMIYLYNYAGAPWKTQYWVRQVLDRMYHSGPDGYCGDEDNGQTSAWYVFSALGFYPVTPGTQQYVVGAPLFRKATLRLENGNTFTIVAPENNQQNLYIQRADLNGGPLLKNWLGHAEIQKGGTLRFTMGPEPDTTRGTSEAAYPYSFSRDDRALLRKLKVK